MTPSRCELRTATARGAQILVVLSGRNHVEDMLPAVLISATHEHNVLRLKAVCARGGRHASTSCNFGQVIVCGPCACQVDVQTSTAGPATSVMIDETGIAWKSDIRKKYGDQQVANFNVVPATRGGGTVTGERHLCCTRA